MKTIANRTKVIPVVATMPADLLTPLAVYLKLADGAANSFLLESVEGGRNLARYSFIGAGANRVMTGEVFAELREHFAEYFADPDSELPPFIGGAIGYLGFECCEWFEPTLTSGREKDAAMMIYDTVVAFDHAKQIVKIISLDFEGEPATAQQRNSELRVRLEDPSLPNWPPVYAGRSDADIVTPTSNWEREAFENAVTEIKELINAGECYQAVMSQCFSRPTSANAVAIYRAIRSINPSPYMFLLDMGHKQVIGASPEMLVRCEDRKLQYRPIAGTRPRGRTTAEDAVLADEMRRDAKEVAEHLMLVDLGRNDLGRVAEFGSVKVDTLMSVEKYSHVQHLVSALSANLRDGLDRFDALAACFPAGTVSGAPKVRAIEIIRKLEPTSRGVYAGAVGYFDYAGNMDTCIAIRTMVLENGIAKIQAGAGIVADSVPSSEFDETVNKAKVLQRAIDIAESGKL
ncbi:MAG TPA: anthranilate synthase component I family protein [Pyrinomonadaceae bacterium]|nr:anthranilate synthase component I family protein [Pyrinomonadaceae bacterium]